MEFRLAFGAEEKAAPLPVGDGLPRKSGGRGFYRSPHPDEGFNSLISHFLPIKFSKGKGGGPHRLSPVRRRLWIQDQLRTSAPLLTHPKAAQRQITRCCAVQFEEGTSSIGGTPAQGRRRCQGVRTRFSDDLIFLPGRQPTYAKATGTPVSGIPHPLT